VDDQELGLRIRKLFLESFGYTVLTASGGTEGLNLLDQNAVDALILDYRMPNMDGAEVAKLAHQKHPALPIILLSGYISEFPQELHGDVTAFVAKGSPPQELLQKLETILGRKPCTSFEEHAVVVEQTRDLVERVTSHIAKTTHHVGQAKHVVSSNASHLEEFKGRWHRTG
jgi:CheY-like chemotaxis protein